MIHIHNGDLVAAFARRSNIPGEHVTFRESLVTGEVTTLSIETRARALASAHRQELLRVSNDLFQQEQLLERIDGEAVGEAVEIVLWFEHDLYCLVHFIYLLQRFGEKRLSIIWNPTPLGECDERQLHLCFDSRAAVTPAMLKTAREVWRAYTSPDPTSLNKWLERDAPELPFLREGLTLHASRFPSTRNGLGEVENRALTLIAAGVTDFISLFDRFNAEVPRFGLGDAEVLRSLRALAERDAPLITMSEAGEKAIFELTAVGERVLGGEVDDLSVHDPDFWLGGAHVTKESVWRWDGSRILASR